MQIQLWEILNHQAQQNWTKPEQAEKFIIGLLKIKARKHSGVD